MLASQIPTKFAIPFANGAAAGTIRPIPVASQDQTNPATRGAASLTDGFPVATGQPLSAGGVPPWMQDFNGILNQITAWLRWQNAGGPVPFDQTFCTAIGGYPIGAILESATVGVVWLNLADNNTTNPDSGASSNWAQLVTSANINTFISAAPVNTGPLENYIIATGTTTVTVPSWATSVDVELWGAGGGGGGSSANSFGGAGGGAGAYAKKHITGLTPGATLSCSVGSGGSGGASGGGAGGSGGATSFGSYVTAGGGGGGGFGTSASGGAGGVATNGDININGPAGGPSIGTVTYGGAGGSSPRGGGGGTGGSGVPGGLPGGAGGGPGSALTSAGSAGAQGAISYIWRAA